MGGFCTQSTTTLPDPKSVLSGTQIPEWVSAAGRQLYEQSAEMAASPFPTYTGQRVATYGDALDDQGNRIQVGMSEPTAPTVQDAEDFFRQNISSDQNIFNPRMMPAVEGYTPPPLTMDDLTDDARQQLTDAGFSFDTPEARPIFAQERLTAQEREAGRLLSEGAETYQPFIDDASAMASTLGQGFQGATRDELLGDAFSTTSAQPFMDIYQTSVDPAVAEIERQTQRNLITDSAEAARMGAFGGSRQGLREAETITEGSRLAGDVRRQAGAAGLEFASQRFDQERAARLAAEDAQRAAFETDEASRLRATQELQGFAPLVQGLQEQAASGLITAGQAQRQLDQMALDLAYSDYVEQREYPFQMANFALGALQGVPYETRTIGLEQGQQYVQNPSVYGQTIGGLGSLASAYYLGNRRT
jgi:hypothetical protein